MEGPTRLGGGGGGQGPMDQPAGVLSNSMAVLWVCLRVDAVFNMKHVSSVRARILQSFVSSPGPEAWHEQEPSKYVDRSTVPKGRRGQG